MRGDSCSTLLAPLTPQIVEVLNDIERMEKDWLISDYPADHSYGRVPGEKDLRFWSIPASTGMFLYSLIQAKKPKLILEVGTSAAYSTIWMGVAARTYGGSLYTLEICPEKLELAKQNIKLSGLEDTVHIVSGDALELTRAWPSEKMIDFVFLDADKENYLTYLKNLLPNMSKDAILCADNALDYRALMQSFLEEACRQPKHDAITMNIDNGILMMCPKA